MEGDSNAPFERHLICSVNVYVPQSILVLIGQWNLPRSDIIDPVPLPGLGGPAAVRISVVLKTDGVPIIDLKRIAVHIKDVPEGAHVEIDGEFARCTYWPIWGSSEPIHVSKLNGDGLLASVSLRGTSTITGTVFVYKLGPLKPEPDTLQLYAMTARQEGVLCDIVLRVAETEFPAHKLVLSAASPVFRGMFSGKFKEARVQEVSLTHGCSTAVFAKFLDFLYSSKPDLSGEVSDLVQMLELASYYMVDQLKEKVVQRLSEVNVNNALPTMKAALEHPVVPEVVLGEAASVALDNFGTISRTPEWDEFQTSFFPAAVIVKALFARRSKACK